MNMTTSEELCRILKEEEGPDLDDYAPRGVILHEALEIINGERQDSYGDPEDSFRRIGHYWSAYLSMDIQPKDVAMMMTLLKIAREQNQSKIDNLVDAAGYIGLAADMEEEEQGDGRNEK